MRYQLASVLGQVKHLKMAQVQEMGTVEEWVFPLEKALEMALESLQVKESQKVQVKPLETAQGKGLETDLVLGMWE
jgi:hypothetical protein